MFFAESSNVIEIDNKKQTKIKPPIANKNRAKLAISIVKKLLVKKRSRACRR